MIEFKRLFNQSLFLFFAGLGLLVLLNLALFHTQPLLANWNDSSPKSLKLTNEQLIELKNRLEGKNIPGGIAIIKLDQKIKQASFQDKPLLILENHNQQKYALIGLALNLKPSRYLIATDIKPISFLVSNFQYQEQRINLTQSKEKFITPPQERIERIKNERERANQMIVSNKEFLPQSLNFIKPTEGILTSPFGLKRFFNDQPRNPHNGIDFANKEGTPIWAAASGEVIDVHDYYYNGKTIFINHGFNLISVYIHLSQALVAVGDFVEQGQVIAEMGETGRTTAPNLHFGIYLNGSAIDPSLLISN